MEKIGLSLLIILLVMAVILPACTTSTTESTEAFCDSLQELAAAWANVESIDANTSVDQVRQYEEELRTAWDNMINARADLEYARFQEFEAAYRELADSLGQISGDVTVAEALPSVQAATTTFEAELTEIRTTVCDFSPTATP
jgi:cell division protein FtsX